MGKRKRSPVELKAIKLYYAEKAGKKSEGFPNAFPFWARLKISKRRITLVIDESDAINKKTKKTEPGFVHREATHSYKKGDVEEVVPNPDKTDSRPMYLKRPRKLPKYFFLPHNKDLDMPEYLKERYSKNNKKK